MKKLFIVSVVALSCFASSCFGADNYRDSRGVVRRSANVTKPEKQPRQQGTQQGTPVDLDAIVNGLRAQNNPVGNDYIAHTYAGDVSSVFGQQQKHTPTGFKTKEQQRAEFLAQHPEKANKPAKVYKPYKNQYNQYNKNGKHIRACWE